MDANRRGFLDRIDRNETGSTEVYTDGKNEDSNAEAQRRGGERRGEMGGEGRVTTNEHEWEGIFRQDLQ